MKQRRRWVRLQYAFVGVLTIGIIFIFWQFFGAHYIAQQDALEHAKRVYQNTVQEEAVQNLAIQRKINLLRGSRVQDIMHYRPNKQGQFSCMLSGLEIDFLKVNDDYCDCPRDGSDEPGTSACSENGRFYCTFHQRASKPELWVSSGRVNDGICDCCDGSDEWKNVTVPPRLKLSDGDQRKFGVYQVPCTFRCF